MVSLCQRADIRRYGSGPGSGHRKRPLAHPEELTYPCCLPTLGELGELLPREEPNTSLADPPPLASRGLREPMDPWPVHPVSAGGLCPDTSLRPNPGSFKSIFSCICPPLCVLSIHDQHESTLSAALLGDPQTPPRALNASLLEVCHARRRLLTNNEPSSKASVWAVTAGHTLVTIH